LPVAELEIFDYTTNNSRISRLKYKSLTEKDKSSGRKFTSYDVEVKFKVIRFYVES